MNAISECTTVAGDPSSHDDFAPVFIVGTARSGTTLTATTLSRHSQLAVPPETLFMSHIVRRTCNRRKMLARVEHSKRCRDLGVSPQLLAEKFGECPATYSWLFRVLLESYATRLGKPVVAEKSPVHLLYVPTLLKWYPKARFVLVVRDGRDCVLSMKKVPWAHDNLVRHAAQWSMRMNVARKFLKDYTRSFHVLRYEAFVLDPEQEIQRLMQFLELEFEHSQLVPGTQASPIPAWEAAWKAKAAEAPDQTRIASWRKEANDKTVLMMDSVMHQELAAWGYEVESRSWDILAILKGTCFYSPVFSAARRFEQMSRF